MSPEASYMAPNSSTEKNPSGHGWELGFRTATGDSHDFLHAHHDVDLSDPCHYLSLRHFSVVCEYVRENQEVKQSA